MTLNKDLRRRMLEKGQKEGLVHYSSSLSCLDFIAYLYDNVLREDDHFILSKGHAGLALYPVLEKHGFKPKWTMHPDYDPKNGVYATTGSLGHGLPIALGYAISKKLRGNYGKTYVLIGDGESAEGTNAEALTIAANQKVNLTVVVDWNKHQVGGNVQDVSGLTFKTLTERFEGYGCNVFHMGGHNPQNFTKLKTIPPGLNAIILSTVLGKGVSMLEREQPHSYRWRDNMGEYRKALEELK